MSTPRTRRKGFTLLEMVAVLVIILVLAGLAIPTYQAVIGETRENAAVLSAKALRNHLDSWAATQQVAPAYAPSEFYDIMCNDLPGCGSDVVLSTSSGVTTLLLEFGSDDKCAEITWATTVGGQSTVAAAADCSAFDSVGPVTVEATYVGTNSSIQTTLTLGTYTFADGWEVTLTGATVDPASPGNWPNDGSPLSNQLYYRTDVHKTGNSDVDGGGVGWIFQARDSSNNVLANWPMWTTAPWDVYNNFVDLAGPVGTTGSTWLVPGYFNGTSWVPYAGQTAQQIITYTVVAS
jgi:prepilin-type N-terminal cleavage/methylation domain-containing protein